MVASKENGLSIRRSFREWVSILDYIPINSIDEIDPRKISIRDLNKKYIDREGNRYATRFNLKTRQVEIVRLARSMEEARRLQLRIKNEKTGSSGPAPSPGRPSPSGTAETEDYYHSPDIPGSRAIADKELLDDCSQEVGKIRERQQAVLNTLRKQQVFEKESYDGFSEIARKVDTESWQAGEEAINYYKELYSYPRPVTHYLNRLSAADRSWVESLGDEESRLDLIRKLEMYRTFHNAFQSMYAVSTDLKGMIEEMPEESQSRLSATQTMAMRDVLPSLEIIQENCLEKMASLDEWLEQVRNG